MRKIYTIAILLLGSIGVFAQDEIINIPDAKFKEALLNHDPVIDTNGDNEIQKSEAEAFTGKLNLKDKKIPNLNGVEYFVNMTELYAYGNDFDNIDVSKNIALTHLTIGGFDCDVKVLDVSKNIALTHLDCSFTELTHIDVSKNIALTHLTIWSNDLETIDVSKNTELIELKVYQNHLTELDLSKNTKLEILQCSSNELKKLDLSENIKLDDLSCYQNNLNDLKIAESCRFKSVYCQGNSLTFSDLAQFKFKSPYKFYYDRQSKIFAPRVESEAFKVDYSSEAITGTKFIWYNIIGEVIDDESCIEPIDGEPGKFNINKPGAYYCELKNSRFYKLTLLAHTIAYDNTTSSEVVNIPDENFKLCLLTNKDINLNGDAQIQNDEATNFTGEINAKQKEITDLTGIEAFVNITKLDCSGNYKLKGLDVSNNTLLTELNCSGDFDELDVTGNILLTELNCSGCNLKELDISKNTQLTKLNCSGNELTRLDVSKNTALVELLCNSNDLEELNIENCESLVSVQCEYNTVLKKIRITNLPKLEIMKCKRNALLFSEMWSIKSKIPSGCDTDFSEQSFKINSTGAAVKGIVVDLNSEKSVNGKPVEFEWKHNFSVTTNPSSVEQFDGYKFRLNSTGYYNLKMTHEDFGEITVKAHGSLYGYNQTLTFNEIPEAKVNDKITLNASSSSGQEVTYWIVSGKAELDDNILTPLTEGTLKIKASAKTGGFSYLPVHKEISITVTKRDQTVTFNPPTTAKINDKITLNATASTGMDITYEIVSGDATLDGNILTATTEGELVVKAVQAGNAEYQKVEKEVTIQVTKRDQTITFDIQKTVFVNDKITLNATASTGMDITYEIVSGDATLDGNILTATTEGALAVKAVQAGNAEYQKVEKEVTIQVTKRDQTITFDIQKTVFVNDKITLNTTASTGLDVTYEIVSGKATLDGNVLTATTEGALVVKAVQAGNAEYAKAEKEVTIQVSKRNQTITFTVEGTVKVNDKITLEATASTGLDITYEIVSGEATLNGNIVTFTKAGVVEIKATQAGNGEYKLVEKTVSVTVTKSTAIDMLQTIGAKIYPNPVTDILNIELPTTENYTVSIYNSIGDVVTQTATTSSVFTIDMSAYKSGIYIVKINTNNKSYSGKIVKR